MKQWLSHFWVWLRAVSGDDAYDQYLRHHHLSHPGAPLMSRRAFYIESQDRKWSGVNRCC